MFKISDLHGKKPEPAPNSAKAKKKVLVIEDEEMIWRIYQQVLVRHGYEVYSALNGEEGLRKIVKVSPNLIFLDLMMPVMDGKTMLFKLKNDPEYSKFKHIPVVVTTNAGDIGNIRDTMVLGDAIEFVVKSNIEPSQIADIANKYFH